MMPGSSLTKRQHYERIRSTMEAERSSFLPTWRELNDFILPMRGRFSISDANRGRRRSEKIIDSTATIDARTCASGMMSGITSPARPWFRLTTPDPDLANFGPVKTWLHSTEERLRSFLARSNFYSVCPTVYQDLAVFGTAAAMIVEDDHRVVRFINFPIGSFCYDVDQIGDPSILTRVFRMTVRQLVAKFGLSRCSQAVQDLWKNAQTETWIDVVHIIDRNEAPNRESLRAAEAMAFWSCYYEIGSQSDGLGERLLRESGFEEFPVLVPVWETTGEDVYGTNSPGLVALGDVKQLQAMEKKSLQAVEKMVSPPMTGPSAMKTVRASILPGDITYADTREGVGGFRPAHEVRFVINEVELKEQQCRQRIDRAFFADLFLMLSYMDQAGRGGDKATAAEIYERHEEKLLALGPVLETLNLRWLDPTIDRLFAIAERRGLLEPTPPDLQGVKLKVEYISMMHQAQKTQSLGGFRSLLEFALPMAERDPAVLDRIDSDRIMQHVVEATGVPPDVLRSQEDVDELRAARGQAQAAAQKAEQDNLDADTAKTLSETKTDESSALRDLAAATSVPEMAAQAQV